MMDTFNSKMAPLFFDRQTRSAFLPDALKKIIDNGVSTFCGASLFASKLNKETQRQLEAGAYFDLSGFEFTNNKIFIEDLCDSKEVIDVSFLFVDLFSEVLQSKFNNLTFLLILSLEVGGEFGTQSMITFYVDRCNEQVLDTSDIEKFIHPIFVRKLVL